MNRDDGREAEFLVRREGERLYLCAPAVGAFSGAVPRGAVLTTERPAGWLTTLGRGRRLVVPSGIEGRVAIAPPPERARPVAFGDVLYELVALEPGGSLATAHADDAAGDVTAVRAPHAGRFWSRPSPDAAPYAPDGAVLVAGSAVGLIEVMKTFSQVAYRPGAGLPERARVVRSLIADGAEVDEGSPLLEIEPA